MGGSLLFTLASSLTPPSSFSSLLQPSLCCITSRGDREVRSEACSSHPLSHLVNCFPSSSLLYCTTPRISAVLFLWDVNLWEKPFSLFLKILKILIHLKRRFLFFKLSSHNSVLHLWYSDPVIIPLWLPLYVSTGVVKTGLLLCVCCQILEKGALYEIWL